MHQALLFLAFPALLGDANQLIAPGTDATRSATVGLRAEQPALPLRVATYNAFLNRFTEGELIADLSTPDDAQAQKVAAILQITRPDVVLLNEFDFDAAGQAVDLFRQNYLNVPQGGAEAIDYPYVYLAPSNTGIPTGFDLNNNGAVVNTPGAFGYGDDCYGFGAFPGQFAFVLLSRYPIDGANARTFQNFLWKDMPGALLPDDLNTPEAGDWYSPEELAIFRLSSKSHWDVPVLVDGRPVHILCAHPTPPVFDGPEDRNGRRNFDEIRFWADYVTPANSGYIYDDQGGLGGLDEGARFVIVGDYNADRYDGDGIPGAIAQLLDHPGIVDANPGSNGGYAATFFQGGNNPAQKGNPALDTGDFTDIATTFAPSGNLRVDYVLPSANLHITKTEVFWPAAGERFFSLVGAGDPFNGSNVISSDHRLVYADVLVGAVDLTPEVPSLALEFLGQATVPFGTLFEGTQVGGLSGICYDKSVGKFLAISDDRSFLAPARYYRLDIALEDGALSDGDISFEDTLTLLKPDATTFPAAGIDPEGIALTKDGALFISSEGDVTTGLNPFVNRFGVGGTQAAELLIPGKYLVGPGTGIRNNLAFESLTLVPGDATLLTATENALFQDGPAASLTGGSPSRILSFDLVTGLPGAEYIYWTDPVAFEAIPAGQFSTNGLVELLALDADTLLAMERSFSVGVGNTIRLFEVALAGASDVSGVEALNGQIENFVPVQKSLLLDLDALGVVLDNVEGMVLGPVLADGRRTLILCSDDNFSATQFTQFLAFAITPAS